MKGWVSVKKELPAPGRWVVVAEEDDAGWAYALGEFVSGEFIDFAHGKTIPRFWIELPNPPDRSAPDPFAPAEKEPWS